MISNLKTESFENLRAERNFDLKKIQRFLFIYVIKFITEPNRIGMGRSELLR